MSLRYPGEDPSQAIFSYGTDQICQKYSVFRPKRISHHIIKILHRCAETGWLKSTCESDQSESLTRFNNKGVDSTEFHTCAMSKT